MSKIKYVLFYLNKGEPSSKSKYVLIIDSEKYCKGKVEKNL